MIVWLFGVAAAAMVQTAAEAPAGSPERAAADFVAAFNIVDEARFDSAWSDRATVFWPGPGQSGGRRIEGKAAVLAAFHAMFERLRAERTGPRYLDIRPLDLHVLRLGDSAVVTFHLEAKGGVNRRTLVMSREGRAWRIVHLHGSLVTAEAAKERN